MRGYAIAVFGTALLAAASPALAHPAPFTYLDIRLQPGTLDITLVAHVFDVAHDLQIDPPDRLLEPGTLTTQNAAVIELLSPRLTILANGKPLTIAAWSRVEAVPDRQSIRFGTRVATGPSVGVLEIDAKFFPYDPAHQTFVNVYEGENLTLQAILDVTRSRLEYFAGSSQGTLAVLQRFVPSGLKHILGTPEHWAFVVGLLLLGGSLRRLGLIGAGFVAGHLAALVLVTFNLLRPPARIVDPAIALSIVYVGADNLMVRGGRDMRAWIAAAFGLIHGFWFASALSGLDLPKQAFGWSLFAFNTGADIAQIAIVFFVGAALAWVHNHHAAGARRLVAAGSVVAIAAGAYWFIQRVFFPGGFV